MDLNFWKTDLNFSDCFIWGKHHIIAEFHKTKFKYLVPCFMAKHYKILQLFLNLSTGGLTLTVSGYGFPSTATVHVDDVLCPTVELTSTEITCTVPASVEPVRVCVFSRASHKVGLLG